MHTSEENYSAGLGAFDARYGYARIERVVGEGDEDIGFVERLFALKFPLLPCHHELWCLRHLLDSGASEGVLEFEM